MGHLENKGKLRGAFQELLVEVGPRVSCSGLKATRWQHF